MLRQPIVVLVGHIDHGKSSILEHIRGITITKAEAGGITQSIKSYNVPLTDIQRVCGALLQQLKQEVTLPGLLFLDSPGHAAFNNMRKRGGNLADIAILVVDINEGMKEQSLECLEILKQYKTPFLIALNKIDLLKGWRSDPKKTLLENIQQQSQDTQRELDTKLYEILGVLAEKGLQTERFDRVNDYTNQVAMVPVSAKTSEGMPELLMVLTGLAQKYLENTLDIEENSPGKATVLEVQEESGMGTTLEIVLYDGTLKQNDQIVIGNVGEPIVTKVRSLFEQQGKKLAPITEARAAQGIKLVAPNVKDVIGGMPLVVANEDLETKKQEVQKEVESVLIDTDNEGVIVKADTLGSLEALVGLLQEKGMKIRKASIGNITKNDISEACAETECTNRVILGFNVKSIDTDSTLKIITNEVIYKIIEDYTAWKVEEEKKEELKQLDSVVRPFKLRIMPGFVFRQSNPAVVGVRIEAGFVKTTTRLMKHDGSRISQVKSMQLDAENVNEGKMGQEVAMAIPDVIVGRQIKEGDILYSELTEEEFRKLKCLQKLLPEDEIRVLKEIVAIKRKQQPLWGT